MIPKAIITAESVSDIVALLDSGEATKQAA